jgi:hypothetical protein
VTESGWKRRNVKSNVSNVRKRTKYNNRPERDGQKLTSLGMTKQMLENGKWEIDTEKRSEEKKTTTNQKEIDEKTYLSWCDHEFTKSTLENEKLRNRT